MLAVWRASVMRLAVFGDEVLPKRVNVWRDGQLCRGRVARHKGQRDGALGKQMHSL